MKIQYVRCRFAALALILATLTAIGSQPAFAVVPEIKADPHGGKYVSNPDLEAALATMGPATTYAKLRWRRAPWFGS